MPNPDVHKVSRGLRVRGEPLYIWPPFLLVAEPENACRQSFRLLFFLTSKSYSWARIPHSKITESD